MLLLHHEDSKKMFLWRLMFYYILFAATNWFSLVWFFCDLWRAKGRCYLFSWCKKCLTLLSWVLDSFETNRGVDEDRRLRGACAAHWWCTAAWLQEMCRKSGVFPVLALKKLCHTQKKKITYSPKKTRCYKWCFVITCRWVYYKGGVTKIFLDDWPECCNFAAKFETCFQQAKKQLNLIINWNHEKENYSCIRAFLVRNYAKWGKWESSDNE